ncbi:MAG: PD-(D/E)XK nuclease family protein [Bacteroidales bacterium]|nr:PD-(D/E)XK nuclease family protein [Bacteroidales bacterium]
MESFIDICVADILQKQAQNLQHTTIVFPSKRAMVFFKKSLGEQISQPIFLPKLTTIQDFCISRQDFTIPDDFTLVYQLYTSFKKIAKSNEPFESFYPWGEMLLSDFDDIDKYLIKADDMFQNIADNKEIDSLFSYLNEEQIAMISRFWDTTKITGEQAKNDVRRNFVEFWKLLPHIYKDFKEKLAAQNLCFEGMAMRNVAESSVEKQQEIFGDGLFIFLGFNALSQCEAKIFSFLQNRKQAMFYWDYDSYYQNDESHEAGIFTRKNIQKFPNELSKEHFFNFCNEKNIRIIRTPNEITQAKLCNELLSQFPSLEQTAIVLADEKLIVPLMKSIPNNIRYNITLGYPIRSSAAYTFFESILDLCNNKKGKNLYFKDVLRICENSLIPSDLQENAKTLHKDIVKNKKITISEDDCIKLCNLPYIFKIPTTVDTYIQSLCDCIVEFCKNANLEEIDTSIFYTIYTELSALKTIIEKNEIQYEKISFINSLLKKSLQGKNIAIEGQPLEGLQVMGILETRMLDFKNIIMTSVMDGNLPKTSVGGSFIPYNLRVAFGMPTIKEQSAMYSYYFYRLLQRCENLTLLYCENSGDNKSEKSRFILQLLYESPFKILSQSSNNPQKTINGITTEERSYTITPTNSLSETIEKNRPEVRAYIDKITSTKTLAPTVLLKYIQCQKQFYYYAIKQLRKPEEISELPQALDLGKYFHDAMQGIYEKYTSKLIDSQVIDGILQDVDSIKANIASAMRNNHAPQNVANENSKEFQAIFKQIQNALIFDKKQPFKLIALESDEANIALDNGVKIGGRIDRVDFQNDVYKIIDYKTGKCSIKNLEEKLTVADCNLLFDKSITQDEAFQALFYAYILKKLHPERKYQPNLFFVQCLSHPDNKTRLTVDGNEVLSVEGELYQQFEENLRVLIDDLISKDGYFEESQDAKYCKRCDFRTFCHK